MDSKRPLQVPMKVDEVAIMEAVNDLLQWYAIRTKTSKLQHLNADSFLYLAITLKKKPVQVSPNPFKIILPHPLQTPLTSKICLIIGDKPKHTASEAAKKKLLSEDITISTVLKLSKMKSDYRDFEKKRKLCDSFDVFLADRRVSSLVPKFLGKPFIRSKKFPVPVDLSHKSWKEEIERSCGSALFFLPTGTCSVFKVARASMDRKEIVCNVAAAIMGVSEVVPRKWSNIRSFHLKFSESFALPVYQGIPVARLKSLEMLCSAKETREEVDVMESERVGDEAGDDSYSDSGSEKSSDQKMGCFDFQSKSSHKMYAEDGDSLENLSNV